MVKQFLWIWGTMQQALPLATNVWLQHWLDHHPT